MNAQDQEVRKVGSFNEVKVGQAINVVLHRSNEEKVVIQSSNIDLEEVETEVSNGELRLSLNGDRYKNVDVVIDVYYKNLKSISVSSAASLKATEIIKGDGFELDVSSAGSVDLSLDVHSLEVDVSSAADAKLSGKTHDMEVDVSSAGGIDAYGLAAENVDVSVSSAGSAKIYVTKSLQANASSGGSIKYKGSPERSNSNSSSGGSVKRSN